MMSSFLAENREELIHRCARKVAQRPHRQATEAQLSTGIPLLMEQLQRTLEAEELHSPPESFGGASAGGASDASELRASAVTSGKQLVELGFTVDEVARDCGDLCQAITELAFEQNAAIGGPEFRALNQCMDIVIAEAGCPFCLRRAC